jgi:hypothetical protein
MTYDHFIAALKQHQTAHVKALAFPESCAPQKIPDSFASLLPDVVELLEKHIQQFCKETQEILILFSLQPGSVTVNSDTPITLNRIINDQCPTNHLCCSLSYLIVPKTEFKRVTSWQGAQTIMVDFTTGVVMDGDRYLSLLFSAAPAGIAYGNLNSTKLAQAWAVVH